MQKTCAVSGKKFIITDEDKVFYEKMGVSEPTLCPAERMRRRLAWRTQWTLYRRKCDKSGKTILSMYHPDAPFPVYHLSEWRDDTKYDPLEYGRDFDFSRPFFEQYAELLNVVPHPHAIIQDPIENSEYSNRAANIRNCYLSFGISNGEDLMYCETGFNLRDCVDGYMITDCELCYECVTCTNCYASCFLFQCQNCSDSWFLQNCIGCKNCFGCTNLRNKQYYFLNEKLSKEAYEEKIKSLELHKWSQIKNMRHQFFEFAKRQPHKYGNVVNVEDCTGDDLKDCKNCKDCYDMEGAEDCRYGFFMKKNVHHCYDNSFWGNNFHHCYETSSCGIDSEELRFCFESWHDQNLTYCGNCQHSQNCFGCYGLKKYQYCIFNKQYTKEDYFALREKIIEHMKKTGEWGEFFPIEMSPFGYNETVAHEYFPLKKEEALALGYGWRDKEIQAEYQGVDVQVSDSIHDVTEDVLKEILTCEKTGKNYRLVKSEFKFYKQMGLPIPRICPEERHLVRLNMRNPRILHDRQCDQCSADIKTTYSPDRPEKVYCEQCYLNTVT